MTGSTLTFWGYQDACKRTAVYPGSGESAGLTYTALGLVGEAGEIANKVKKVLRDDGGDLSAERRMALAGELGDVLWYVAQVATEAGLDLDFVAAANLHKLADRQEREVLRGSGDER